MKRHAAVVQMLESFELGKNTGQNSGLVIKVFGKAEGKLGPKLGTIRIGQGTFDWWTKSAKFETKTGKQDPSLSLTWSDFADLMNKRVKGDSD